MPIRYEPRPGGEGEAVICPVCKDAGLQSTVRDGGTSETLVGYMPFYDENGKRHVHDDNCRITGYWCSRGHEFSHREQRTAKCCDWKGKTECFCHPLGFKIYPH
jgi:hypothetical protein